MSKQNIWIVAISASIILLAIIIFGISSKKPLIANLPLPEWSVGSSTSPLVIVEWSDYQCPACAIYYLPIKKIVEKYQDKIKLVFKHYPLPQHKNAILAAKYAEAAGLQGKFFDMSQILFEKQKEWEDSPNPSSFFDSYVKLLGLDQARLIKDLKSKAVAEKIKSDTGEGVKVGVAWTPSFMLNGKIIQNPENEVMFESIIKEAFNIKNES